MADGSIRISTELDTSGVSIGLDGIEQAVEETGERIRQVGEKAKTVFTGMSMGELESASKRVTRELDKINTELDKIDQEIAKIQAETDKMLPLAATDEQAKALLEMEEYQTAELVAKREELAAQAAQYQAQLQAITSELERQGALSAGGQELKQAKSDEDFLAKITSESEYTQVLESIQQRMSMIEQQAQRIADKNGIVKSELLEQDQEYKQLQRRLELLQQNQDRFKGKVDSTTNATNKLGAAGASAGNKTSKSLKSAQKSADSLGKSISQGIKRMTRMTLAAIGIQSAFALITRATNAYTAGNQDLSNQINAIWNVLGQVIGPVVEKIVNWISIAIAYVNAFIKALTGIDFVARANAAALEKQSKATKEAANASQLAGFDEINKLNDTSSSGTDGSGEAALFKVDVDTSGFEKGIKNALEGIKKAFKTFSEWFKTAFGPSISALSDAFGQLKGPAKDAASSIGQSFSKLWNETLAPFGSWFIGEWIPGIVNSWYTNMAPIFGDVMSTAIEETAADFEWFCNLLSSLFNDILVPALELTSHMFDGMMSGMKSAWDEYGQPLMEGFVKFKNGLQETFDYIWFEIVKPIWDNLVKALTDLWDQHLKPLWDELVKFFMSIGNFILTLWNNFLKPIVDWFIKTFGPTIMNVINGIINFIKPIVGFISDVVRSIIKVIRGILDFFTGIFSGDMKAALNGLIDLANGIIGGIIDGFKGLVNIIIGGINLLWRAIYSGVSWIINGIGDLVSWLGGLFGQEWGWELPAEPPLIPEVKFDTPQIPKLAQGGIVNNPGRGIPAVIGEAGREAVLPLDRNTEWMDELAARINGLQDDKPIVVQLYLSGKKIHEEMVNISRKKDFAMNGV